MKRLMAMLLVLLMALAGASAEMTAEKVFEVKDASFFKGTNLMSFREEPFGYSGIMAPDGTKVVGTEYLGLSMTNGYGYVSAAKEDNLNGSGMIDLQGNVLIPFEYGEFDILSKDWVVAITLKESTKDNYDYQSMFGGYGSGYYLIESRTFYYMPTLKAVGTLPREGFDKAAGYEGFLIIKGTDGVNTVYDENFQPIGTAEQYYTGYVFLKNGDNWDVKRAGDGKVLFSTPYSVTRFIAKEGVFQVSHEGKAGLIDMQGNVIIEPKYDVVYGLAGEHVVAQKDREKGKMGLLDKEGNELTDFIYDEIITTYNRGVSGGLERMVMVNGYAPVEAEGKIGFIDATGRETVAPAYAKGSVEVAGNTLTYTAPDGKTTVVAADGTVTELTYQDVKRVYDGLGGRVFTAKNDVGQVAVLDWHGNILIPFGPYYDYSVNTSNDGTMLLLQNKDTRNVEVYKLQ